MRLRRQQSLQRASLPYPKTNEPHIEPLITGILIGIHIGHLVKDPLERLFVQLGLLDEIEVIIIEEIECAIEEAAREIEK